MILRLLQQNIEDRLFKGKIILIFGPRQSGKTTLVKEIYNKFQGDGLWMNGDEPDDRELLTNVTSTSLKQTTGRNKIVVIDEAQRIQNIGLTLKLFADNLNNTQVIATGSSAFELANEISEPLTGRKYEYFLYPLSFKELVNFTSQSEEKRLLEHRLVYGYYPEIVSNPGNEKELLSLIAGSLLYKDIFRWEQIKKPAVIEKLLQALALQVGNEVSYHELGQLAGANNETIEKYINLLEKCFVIFRLNSMNRNLRNELKKSKKIYFWDNGIRNAIIKNFNPVALRQDTGALWENFLITERIKANHYSDKWVNQWFWRTLAKQEIDYVEESEGVLYAWEFKWKNSGSKIPLTFIKAYPQAVTGIIDKNNFVEFL